VTGVGQVSSEEPAPAAELDDHADALEHRLQQLEDPRRAVVGVEVEPEVVDQREVATVVGRVGLGHRVIFVPDPKAVDPRCAAWSRYRPVTLRASGDAPTFSRSDPYRRTTERAKGSPAKEEREEGIEMAMDTYMLVAAQYVDEQDALADYDGVEQLYRDLDVIDTYDAAVVTKDDSGKVRIVKKVEEPTRHGAVAGLVVGLAVGALVALFPAVAIGAGLAVGGATGAAIGATAGHVARGMSRQDLMDLGELLDSGTSGLVVVAATDVADRVETAISRGKDVLKKQVQLDADGLKADIDTL
jgi:uncharacterized membrane protein